MNAENIIQILNLQKLEPEGGFFSQTYKSDDCPLVPFGENGDLVERSAVTAIYYMLTKESFSAFHRLKGREVYSFFLGARVELFTLSNSGVLSSAILGPDLKAGDRFQHTVEKETWQGSRIISGDSYDWALLGTVVVPGFDFKDFELADRTSLLGKHPEHADIIHKLTR